MEHRGNADPGAEMLGIGGDGQHGLGADPHQQVVDDPFVVIGDVGDGRRQGEDDVEVADGEQFGLASRQPIVCGSTLALGAVAVAAAVVRDLGVGAVLALRDMTAEGRGAAALDGAHHLELAKADMAGIGCTPCGAVVAEDIRNLEGGPGHDRHRLRWRRPVGQRREAIERADDGADRGGGDVGVKRRGLELGVAEQPYAIMRILLSH
jgi:hypothetical protein